jgi:outer membrane protein
MRQPHPVRLAATVAIVMSAAMPFTPRLAAQGQPAPAAAPGSLAQSAAAAAQTTEPSMQLSVDQAVSMALEQNLGIKIQRLSPQIEDLTVSAARSNWAPVITSTLSNRDSTAVPVSSISPSSTTKTLSTGFGANQTLPWGGSYTAEWSNSRQTSTNFFNNFSPQLQSSLQASYTQPLLRNFSIDAIREQVALSQKGRELSDIQLQTVITQTVRNVKNAYWDLAYAIDNLKANQQSLALSQQSLADNQKRVQVGTMAPIDIVQAQAEVASNEESVIVAQAAITNAEDRLRALIFDPDRADFWQVSIQPTDTVAFQEQAVDVDAVVRNALSRRTDLQQAKNNLDQNDITIRYFHNQLRPDVSATVSYQSVGLGGSQLEPVNPFDLANGVTPSRTVLSQVGFGSVLNDVFSNAYPTWSFGVTFGYPLGTSTSEANLARARLQYQQAQDSLKNLELQITTQVRAAARQVQTSQQVVQAARAARVLQEQKLDAEQKKFAAGLSTNFQVIQAQRDLAVARTSEVQAIANYNKSLVDLEAVQEVPLTGSTSVVPTSTTTGALSTP